MDLSIGHGKDGSAGAILQQVHCFFGRDWYRYINLHIIPVIVHRGDDDRVRTMPGKGILAVGQQQFLVAAPMELFVFVMDAANRADELGKFTIPFI